MVTRASAAGQLSLSVDELPLWLRDKGAVTYEVGGTVDDNDGWRFWVSDGKAAIQLNGQFAYDQHELFRTILQVARRLGYRFSPEELA